MQLQSPLAVDLAAWRQEHGWDKNSVQADMQIDFNPDTLELTMRSTSSLPKVNAVNQIMDDIFGDTAGASRTPGPLADPAAKTVRKIDPSSTVSA